MPYDLYVNQYCKVTAERSQSLQEQYRPLIMGISFSNRPAELKCRCPDAMPVFTNMLLEKNQCIHLGPWYFDQHVDTTTSH